MILRKSYRYLGKACVYCKDCEYWPAKLNISEYEEWKMEHEKFGAANHEGSTDKMEIGAINEMFARTVRVRL